MSEVKNKIHNIFIKLTEDECELSEGFLITEDHSIADIARLAIQEKWDDDLIYFLTKDRENL